MLRLTISELAVRNSRSSWGQPPRDTREVLDLWWINSKSLLLLLLLAAVVAALCVCVLVSEESKRRVREQAREMWGRTSNTARGEIKRLVLLLMCRSVFQARVSHDEGCWRPEVSDVHCAQEKYTKYQMGHACSQPRHGAERRRQLLPKGGHVCTQ